MFTPEERIKNIQNYATLQQKQKEKAIEECIELRKSIQATIDALQPRIETLAKTFKACVDNDIVDKLGDYRTYKMFSFTLEDDGTYSICLKRYTEFSVHTFHLQYPNYFTNHIPFMRLSSFDVESEYQSLIEVKELLNHFDTFENAFYDEIDCITGFLKSTDEYDKGLD